MKTQTVRFLDVALVGPLMVWGGARTIEERPLAGILLTFLGLATVAYNGVNYGRVARRPLPRRRYLSSRPRPV